MKVTSSKSYNVELTETEYKNLLSLLQVKVNAGQATPSETELYKSMSENL